MAPVILPASMYFESSFVRGNIVLFHFTFRQKYNTLFDSVQLLSHVQQASLSITNSRSLLKLMSMSRWCHPTISSFVIPLSFNLSQHSNHKSKCKTLIYAMVFVIWSTVIGGKHELGSSCSEVPFQLQCLLHVELTILLVVCSCIRLLQLHNKLSWKLVAWNNKHLLPHSFYGSGIWKQISWVFLVQGLSWGCSQDVSQS